MGKWLQWLERWIGGGPGGEKRVSVFRWLLIAGLVGIALMILGSFLTVQELEPVLEDSPAAGESKQTFAGGDSTSKTAFADYESAYQSAIKHILQNAVGIGDVDVLVTIDSTEEIVVKDNVNDTHQVTDEKDRSGANRHITDIARSSETVLYETGGNQQPLVLKKIKPKIRGVVIVAKGAENLAVKKMITEAVGKGLDVPAHRISVLPRKQ